MAIGFGIAAAASVPVNAQAVWMFVGGLAGVGAGLAAGHALGARAAEGVSCDELLFYQDAVKQGRALVIAAARSRRGARVLRSALLRHGAESVDAAYRQWRLGLRQIGYRSPAMRKKEAGMSAPARPRARGKAAGFGD
ncbi:MAG: hypothetical protein JO041_06420 [Acidobacteria bacterium]|nr:hypothetical protein [Acidobacteriota bacterium]